jgi:hypothetical protein
MLTDSLVKIKRDIHLDSQRDLHKNCKQATRPCPEAPHLKASRHQRKDRRDDFVVAAGRLSRLKAEDAGGETAPVRRL